MKHCTIHIGRKSFHAKICDTVFSQARGILFSREKAAFFIFKKERKISVHMFFMFHSLDILWFDEKMHIVEIKRNLRPFTFYTPKKKALHMLEVPAESTRGLRVRDTGVRVGIRI